MTVFKHPRGKTWRYDFQWTPPGAAKSKRYTGTTGQLTREDAELVEAEVKRRVRQEAYGIAPFDRLRTPSFTKWAGVHFNYVERRGKVTRLDQLENNLRHVLMFFGARPSRPRELSPKIDPKTRAKIELRAAAAPYHDLRLADPILEPEWIERFEDWMASLGISGVRKNHLRSAASGLYRTALKPAFRKKSNVTSNPFLHIDRDPGVQRDRVLTPAQLWAWIAAAPLHARIAMAIAAYCPKLREGVILELEWKQHLDPDLTRISVERHKARRWKNRSQVALIPDDLRHLLAWLRKLRPSDRYVVQYRHEPVTTISKGLRAAITRANKHLPPDQQMTYGATAGVTFHTIRHTMATLLMELNVPEKLREAVMDQTQQTIQRYTHLRPRHEEQPVTALANRLQLVQAVQGTVQEGGSSKAAKRQQTAIRGAKARRSSKTA